MSASTSWSQGAAVAAAAAQQFRVWAAANIMSLARTLKGQRKTPSGLQVECSGLHVRHGHAHG